MESGGGREESQALVLSWRPDRPCLPAAHPTSPLAPLLTPHPLAAAPLCSGIPVYKGKDETVLEREMHYSAAA